MSIEVDKLLASSDALVEAAKRVQVSADECHRVATTFDWHPQRDEVATPGLRLLVKAAGAAPVLQQAWSVREGIETWVEWRDVPIVDTNGDPL